MVPGRIVSLVPSLTELVFALGRGPALVGRTRFCDAPAGRVAAIPVVGGTKNPDIARIVALAPDLVIANKEENRREDVDALRAAGLDVLVTDPNSVQEALDMIAQLGRLLGASDAADVLISETETVLAKPPPATLRRVLVAVWWRPFMALGSQTYGHDLITRSGATNVAGDRVRYPELSLDDVRALAPELILLPDEPFPFKQVHAAELSSVAPARIIDGRLLWWYGPRMPAAICALRTILGEVPAPR